MCFGTVSLLLCANDTLCSVCRQDQDIEAEDFQKYTEKVEVSLQDCPVQRPPAALMSRQRDSTSKAKQKVTTILSIFSIVYGYNDYNAGLTTKVTNSMGYNCWRLQF